MFSTKLVSTKEEILIWCRNCCHFKLREGVVQACIGLIMSRTTTISTRVEILLRGRDCCHFNSLNPASKFDHHI